MKIVIVVEAGDDVDFARQLAEDIPHQTFSAGEIPIEVWDGNADQIIRNGT